MRVSAEKMSSRRGAASALGELCIERSTDHGGWQRGLYQRESASNVWSSFSAKPFDTRQAIS
jgi:hypothetical protein